MYITQKKLNLHIQINFKMKKLLLLLTVATFSVAGFSQTGPKIEFTAKDNTIDYGTISKDTDSGVRKSTCGCTVPTKPTAPILPGKTDKIEVKYNMNPGAIRKTITVESNAVNYENGVVALKIKGEVIGKPKEANVMEKKKSILEKS